MVGIADALFVLLIAVLGFQFMSATSFGYDEIEFKHILPKIALSFLGANSSIFLVDWVISLCNTMVNALLFSTGGLDRAWVLNAGDLLQIVSGNAAIITLLFMFILEVLAALLVFLYIMRLIVI